MSGQRRRSKRKLRSDAEYDAVIILSSSDDKEANRDLSLEIVEKARKREAKRKRVEEKPRASAQLPVIDLSSASFDDVEAAPPPEAEPSAKKSKKKKYEGDAGKSTYKEMTNRDWAGLTTEPLFCILERLPIKDYIRFGSVCLSWYQTVATKLVSPAPLPPLLIVLPPEGSTTHLIFNPFSNKVEFRLQEPSQLFPLSITTAGYIMYQHSTTAELVVKNPLTGSCLPFPSLTTLPPEVRAICILSATALLSGSTITAVAIAYGYGYNGYGCGYKAAAAFARLGDSNWTFFGDSVYVFSMRFHKGLLYVLTTDDRILTWDPWVHPAPLLTLSTHSLAAKCSVANWPNYSLVESSTGGDLLQVVNNIGKPLEYKVFKLDPACPKWCSVSSLCGEDALMLSPRGVVCISTRDFPELRQNCIYSTLYHEPEDALHVFDLGEGRVVNYHPLPEEGSDWFIPSLD